MNGEQLAELKDAIAQHLYDRGLTEVLPMVGGFTLVAEYTDKDGVESIVTIRDGKMALWQEYGLISHRRLILEGEIYEQNHRQQGGKE